MFKLFGFLETTKELNTKGIGLGLYISKEIVQQFGGDIDFVSELGIGTSFTLVLALEQVTHEVYQVARNRNPIFKKYPKIEIKRYLKAEEEENLTHESNFELFPIKFFESVNPQPYMDSKERQSSLFPSFEPILNIRPREPPMMPNKRLLIVDDEPYNILALQTILL